MEGLIRYQDRITSPHLTIHGQQDKQEKRIKGVPESVVGLSYEVN